MRSVSPIGSGSGSGSGIGVDGIGVGVALGVGMGVGCGAGRRNVDPFLLPLPHRPSEHRGRSVAS